MNITGNLYKLGYPIEKLKTGPPDERVVKATDDLLTRLNERNMDDKVPFALVFSNDIILLQALAMLVPPTFSCSTANSCFTITTNRFMELFTSPTPRNMFDEDMAGETLHAIKIAGLLWWSNFNEMVAGSAKFHGKFGELMSYRIGHQKATVFSCAYSGSYKSAFTEKFIEKVHEHFGETVGSAIETYSAKYHYKSEVLLAEVVEEIEI
jgi:hypothetical protein